jgi:hypothetical protein
MPARLSAEAIEEGTGRPSDEWVAFFDSIGAAGLTHQEIVARASDLGAAPWWRQMVTVAYEQHIGRRLPGQAPDGTFTMNASRTRAGSLDDSLDRWNQVVGGRKDHAGVAVTQGPEVTSSDAWRYWRCQLANGSPVVVNFSDKAAGRSVVAVQHERLDTPEAVDGWRLFWKAVLAER